MDREKEIRLMAYSIWEEDDCCDGHELEHWLKAERIWQEQKSSRVNEIKRETINKPSVKAQKSAKVTKGAVKKT
jgi:hypothetical protein